jgi:hypothetical protein
VYIINETNNKEYYGSVSVKLKPDAKWRDLKSLIPGKIIPPVGIIMTVRDIFIGNNYVMVDDDEVIPQNPHLIRAVVTFSMLYVTC